MAFTLSQIVSREAMTTMQDMAWNLRVAVKRKPLNVVAAVVLSFLVVAYVQHSRSQASHAHHLRIGPPFAGSSLTAKGPLLVNAASPGSVIPSPGREIDVIDAFQDYVRIPETCSLSSLDLHFPFSPLCPDKLSMLKAVSGGGRPGMDMPYEPRGCDMRWFSTEEICDIMSRFETIWIVGDSMMRNLAVALHVFLRADLNEGPRAQWKKEPDGLDCHCKAPFETGACLWYVAMSTKSVWENVPAGLPHSIKCPKDNMAFVECKYAQLHLQPTKSLSRGLHRRPSNSISSRRRCACLG